MGNYSTSTSTSTTNNNKTPLHFKGGYRHLGFTQRDAPMEEVYDLIQLIGEGASGCVWTARKRILVGTSRERLSRQIFAVKEIRKRTITKNKPPKPVLVVEQKVKEIHTANNTKKVDPSSIVSNNYTNNNGTNTTYSTTTSTST